MAVYKRGPVWWYRFTWKGEAIRETTKQTNKRVAEQIEAAHKTSLAKGEVGIRDRLSARRCGNLSNRISSHLLYRASKPNPRRSNTTRWGSRISSTTRS
jgi:hypothetical protein